MAPIRHFLGWSQPALPRAAHWLLATRGADLADCQCVLPTARSGRRFLELLATEAVGPTEGPAAIPPGNSAPPQPLAPPEVFTPAHLPELLVQPAADAPPTASALACRLAQLEALRTLPQHERAPLLPDLPADEDFAAWWALAGRLEALRETLATDGLRWTDLVQRAHDQHVDLIQPERYASLVAVETAFETTLEAWALSHPAPRSPAIALSQRPLLLLGVSDLRPQVLDLLTRAAEAGRPILALIFAPEAQAASFGPFGELQPGPWLTSPIPIRDRQIRFVDRPADQAVVAAEVIGACGASSPDQISLALGEERLAPLFRRTLEAAGAPTRGPGTPADQSPPARLLAALARFHRSSGGTEDLRALLAHPAAEAAWQRTHPPQAGFSPLLQLDDLLNRAPLSAWASEAPAETDARLAFETLARVRHFFLQVLPTDGQPDTPRPLAAWAQPLAQALTTLWDPRPLHPQHPPDQQTRAALEAIASALHAWENLPAEANRPLRSWEATALLMNDLQLRRLPEPTDHAAIEVFGPLELPLDDAPHAVFACLNEGHFPASDHADPFLPETLRRELGLTGSDQRLARDRQLLMHALACHPNLTLICGRHSAQGDPLRPSRLLLACDAETQTRRLAAFCHALPAGAPPEVSTAYKAMVAFASTRPHRVFWAAERPNLAKTNRPLTPLVLPMPAAPQRAIDRLSVTAFRDYLACPYRFYLKHVLGLQPVVEHPPELHAAAFGDLAHAVLRNFGSSDLANHDDAQAIARHLDDSLDHHAARGIGSQRPPAAAVQIEQLRHRLHAFAFAQAQLAQAGWRIERVETRVEESIQVDGTPFQLIGRIDRIDHHPEFGYRLLDFKTADTARKPRATHLQTIDQSPVWVELQLPLYRYLAKQAGVPEGAPMQVGYFNLPKQTEGTRFEPLDADADELALADATCLQVIREVRAGRFWPPGDPPTFHDGLGFLAGDSVSDRTTLIAQGPRLAALGETGS